MSCIILLTLNDDFVKQWLIPSIINNSTNHTIEIIVVYNGYDCAPINSLEVDVITSPLLWVSKGYNIGVERAKGEYVAIFHDDCVLDDSRWIEKATTTLNEETIAVSPEYHGKAAKCVPLVIRKKDYIDIGGFDEHYFAGIEDVDFTYTIKSRNKKIGICDIKSTHYKGMSTALLLAKNSKQLKTRFSKNHISTEEVENLRKYYLSKAFSKGLRGNNLKDKLYLFRKFKKYLFSDEQEFLKEETKLIKSISDIKEIPDISSKNRDLLKTIEAFKSDPP